MSKQSRKHTIGLAGEFLVAGELLRRGIVAAVTYGNAKKADVIAVSGKHALSIEVKTTSQPKWVLGGQLPVADETLWVLVHLPMDEKESPSYFILSGKELHDLLLPQHDAYLTKYREKHGTEFTGKGVVSINKKLMGKDHLEAWQKVEQALNSVTA